MTYTPDLKLKWLLEHRLLFNTNMQHEVFRLIKVAYPEASEDARRAFLQVVMEGREMTEELELDEELRRYEVYNFLLWMKESAPECVFTTDAFDTYQKEHPDFSPRKYPDLTHWSETTIGHESPLSVDDLLEMIPDKAADYLIDYNETSYSGPNREGLLDVLSAAIKKDFEHSRAIITAFLSKKTGDEDILRHIIYGWQQSQPTDEQWNWLLTLILTDKLLFHSTVHSIAQLLDHSLERKAASPIPYNDIELVEQIADFCWDQSKKEEQDLKYLSGEWFQDAINQTGGIVAEVWIRALVQHREQIGKSWRGIPEEYQARFANVIKEPTLSGVMGRVIIVSQLNLFFYWDEQYSRENILPLLDWEANGERASQVWDGFLFWGRPRAGLLSDLLPLYESSFQHLTQFSDSARDRLVEHLAVIAVFSTVNPLEQGWLGRFISISESQDRVSFARCIKSHLKGLDDTGTSALWERWLSDYWGTRNRGSFKTVVAKEAAEMVEWIPYLDSVFDAAVMHVTQGQEPELDFPSVYRKLKELIVPDAHPEALSTLLDYLLHSTHKQDRFFDCEVVGNIVEALIPNKSLHPILRNICDSLTRFGCSNARELNESMN